MNTISTILSIIATIVAAGTLIHPCFPSRRSAITQSITKERMEWIRQTREALLIFAKSYRQTDLKLPQAQNNKQKQIELMEDAQARLETLMRRDTVEYREILEHIDHCIKTGYAEHDYDKLIGLSTYILARAWQRVKIDAEAFPMRSNEEANREVDKRTKELHDRAVSGHYLESKYSSDSNSKTQRLPDDKSPDDDITSRPQPGSTP